MPSPRLTPCLWFNGQAEDAARFYCSVFPNSKVGRITRYGTVGQEQHGGTPGALLTIEFELNGQPFSAMNGGPGKSFSEAVSFQVPCRDQAEIDRYWEALLAGGGEPIMCGWLRDRFGVFWQVYPDELLTMIGDQTTPAQHRAMAAMMSMVKIDLAACRRAYEGR